MYHLFYHQNKRPSNSKILSMTSMLYKPLSTKNTKPSNNACSLKTTSINSMTSSTSSSNNKSKYLIPYQDHICPHSQTHQSTLRTVHHRGGHRSYDAGRTLWENIDGKTGKSRSGKSDKLFSDEEKKNKRRVTPKPRQTNLQVYLRARRQQSKQYPQLFRNTFQNFASGFSKIARTKSKKYSWRKWRIYLPPLTNSMMKTTTLLLRPNQMNGTEV